MKFKDQYKFIRSNMKKNKSRLFMTILATAMGCSFLMVLASVGFGLNKSIISQVKQDRLMTQIEVHAKQENNNYTRLEEQDIGQLEKIEHVKAVSRKQFVQQPLNFHLDDFQASSNAVAVHFPSEIKAGMKLSEGRMPKKSNEVVVGYQFRETLIDPKAAEHESPAKNDAEEGQTGPTAPAGSYKESLLGKTMMMEVTRYNNGKEEKRPFPVKVVGVTEKPAKEWASDQALYMNESLLEDIEQYTGTLQGRLITPEEKEQAKQQGIDLGLPEKRAYDQVNVYADSAEAVKSIDKALKDRKYATYSVINEMKQINLVFLVVKIGLMFVGTIAILIASIGIFNTMTMAVTERTPDIGIMKAIGAHPRIIKRIFLLESGYIGVFGAIIGTVVAYVISIAANLVLPPVLGSVLDEKVPDWFQFSSIPPILTVICIVISLGVALLSGMRPARRATEIDVLKALRRDI